MDGWKYFTRLFVLRKKCIHQVEKLSTDLTYYNRIKHFFSGSRGPHKTTRRAAFWSAGLEFDTSAVDEEPVYIDLHIET